MSIIIGAHHLAEEDTLYATAGCVESVGQARAFHLVLDDLMQSIQAGDHTHEPLRYKLLLLEYLLEKHFWVEEHELMVLFSRKIPGKQQQMLGRKYRRCYEDNLAELSNSAVPVRRLSLL